MGVNNNNKWLVKVRVRDEDMSWPGAASGYALER